MAAARVWTLHPTFHFLYSWPEKTLHILDALSQTKKKLQQPTNVWLWSSGRRSTTVSVIFMGLSLLPGEELSWGKSVMGWSRLLTVFPNVVLIKIM